MNRNQIETRVAAAKPPTPQEIHESYDQSRTDRNYLSSMGRHSRLLSWGSVLLLMGFGSLTSSAYTLEDLGSLGVESYALGINDGGVVVGTSKLIVNGPSRAVVWDPSRNYSILDLGGGTYGDSEVRAVNAAGQMVGTLVQPSGSSDVIIWDALTYTQHDLGNLGSSGSIYTVGINAVGQIAGYGPNASGKFLSFVGDVTGITPLPDAISGAALYQAIGINNDGDIIGVYNDGGGVPHAFLWHKTTGQYELVGAAVSGYSNPTAFNNFGEVVGSFEASPGVSHAFYWTHASGLIDLGTLGGTSSGAQAINDAGQIVGAALKVGDIGYRAFICGPDHVLQDIGVLSTNQFSFGLQINAVGVVTGIAEASPGINHAIVWEPLNGLMDLGTLGGTESQPNALNNLNLAVGYSLTASGRPHAFIVDLNKQDPQAIQASVVSDLNSLLGATTVPTDVKALDKVITALAPTESASLWIDPTHLFPATGDLFFLATEKVVGQLDDLLKSNKDLIPNAPLQDALTTLMDNSLEIAQTAINDAATTLVPLAPAALLRLTTAQKSTKDKKISRDKKLLADARDDILKARALAARGKYKQAVGLCGDAWGDAQSILKP